MDIKSYIDTMQTKTKEGITVKELQEYYKFIRDNTEAVKAVIMDRINNSDKHKKKRKATKETLTNECYDNMIMGLVYCVTECFSCIIDFSGNHKEIERKAIEKYIFEATQEQIDGVLAKTIKRQEERQIRYNETITAIKNPQTLDDFKQVKLYRKTPLTEAEQELFDYLIAIHNKEQKEKEQQEKAEKAKTIITGSSDKYTIVADKDTRDNSNIWVVKLNERVERDVFNTIRYQVMKPIDGYWSNFKGGFIFKYDPTVKLLGEQTEQTTEQQEEQPKNSADRLRKVADNMQNTIDDLRRDRLTNTAKRARQAASAEDTADSMERTQNIIRNIALAMDNSELKLINSIDSKAQIDTLNQILVRANCKKKDVENMDCRVWHETTPTADIIKYAEIPSSIIYKDQLQRIIFDIRKEDGFKLISNRLQKLINNSSKNQVDITGYEEEFDKIYKNTDVLKGQYFESAIEERRRLERMGINSVEELRAYLREYWTYKTAVKTTVDPTQKKIKELERQYKLDQKGDINFTPSEIALTMIELADIDNNSRVLEPSAGIGNIADQIKKFTNNVDVCEQMTSYSELLKLKGYNVVGYDFLKLDTYNTYDCIIMNPPFSDEQNHLKHAYDLLKVGGKIISITSPHWTFANDKASQDFRSWFNEVGGEITEELESGTFEMTNVRSQIVVINKETSTMQEAV
jgi:hypothetical protein